MNWKYSEFCGLQVQKLVHFLTKNFRLISTNKDQI